MTTKDFKELFVKQRLKESYAEADKIVWKVFYASAILLLILSLLYDQLFVVLLCIAGIFLILFTLDNLIQQRTTKNLMMAFIIVIWPVLLVIVADQLYEMRFIALAYIIVLAIYQDKRLVVFKGSINGLFMLTYSIPVIGDLAFKDMALSGKRRGCQLGKSSDFFGNCISDYGVINMAGCFAKQAVISGCSE